MTPKSLLRYHMATSSLEDLTQGRFETLLPEAEKIDPEQIERIIMCSGKVYYDLVHRRRKAKITNIAILRIEQLFPFPQKEMTKELSKYKNAKKFIWCQEEPKNQGAWYPSQHFMRAAIGSLGYLEYAGRPTMAAPAVGYPALHLQQMHTLIEEALGMEGTKPRHGN